MAIVAVPQILKGPYPAVFLFCMMFILRVLHQPYVRWYRLYFSFTLIKYLFTSSRPKIETSPLYIILLMVYILCILGFFMHFPILLCSEILL